MEATSLGGAIVNLTPPTANDNLDGAVAVSTNPTPGTLRPLGNTTFVYTAIDSSGNTATATTIVTVVDTTAPIITAPAAITQEATSPAGAIVNFTPIATDAVGVTSLTSAPASGSTFSIGTTVVTVTALDAAGNSSTAMFNVTVQDITPPLIAPLAPIMVNTDPGVAFATVAFAPTATDAVGPVTITTSPVSGSQFPIGTTAVTVTATDGAGNMSTAMFNVTVVDNEQPIINVPANISVPAAPGLATASVPYTVTFSDNAPGATLNQTAGLASGSNFPIGVTTNTFVVTDAAGNTATGTFTVTVLDAEPPVINNLPADITVAIDFPDTSVPVTFTPPTVSDNAPGATIVQTAGPAPGASFPLGTTVVTYTATDASGNVVTASFNVTVNQIPPGIATIAVVADVSDGTFTFSSPEPLFNFPVTTSSGTGQSAAVMIKPGTYVVTAALPDGFGLTGVTCNDSDSTGSVSGKSATINLQSGENVTCTFTSADSRTKTLQTIGRFLKRRNDLLLSSEPGGDRQIARLNGGQSGGGSSGAGGPVAQLGSTPSNAAAFGAEPTGTSTPLTKASAILGSGITGLSGEAASKPYGAGGSRAGSLQLSAKNGISASFSTSLGEIRQYAAGQEQQRLMGLLGEEKYAALGAGQYTVGRTQSAFDVWVEGQYTSFDDDTVGAESNGHFGVIYLGADYVVNSQVLLGFLAQFDDTDEKSSEQSTSVSGQGWMIGPYATIKLSPGLYFQGRAAWGKSSNDISPFLTYTDNFDTERWLVRGKLQGFWNYGPWQFSPSASVAYIEERQESYTDSLTVVIPGQTVSLGQAEFGPEVSYTFTDTDGFSIMPSVGVKGVWNFAEDNGAVLAGTSVGAGEFRGKVEAGLKIQSDTGASLDFSGTYDGIGDSDFEAVTGSVKLRLPLN